MLLQQRQEVLLAVVLAVVSPAGRGRLEMLALRRVNTSWTALFATRLRRVMGR